MTRPHRGGGQQSDDSQHAVTRVVSHLTAVLHHDGIDGNAES
jgi:hypothetical protein